MKHLNSIIVLISLIVLTLSGCAYMPDGKCPHTANAFVKNSIGASIKVTIAKLEGDRSIIVTPEPYWMEPGKLLQGPLEVGTYLIIIWEEDSQRTLKFEVSIRCKSQVWDYQGDYIDVYDYIGGMTPDKTFFPTIF
jgi:hypothetical protein